MRRPQGDIMRKTISAAVAAAALVIVAAPMAVSYFGGKIEHCSGSAPYNMCQNDIRVGLDMRDGKAAFLRHDLSQQGEDDATQMWVEGDSNDTVIIHDLKKQYTVGNYTIYEGSAGSVKVSSAVQVRIANSN